MYVGEQDVKFYPTVVCKCGGYIRHVFVMADHTGLALNFMPNIPRVLLGGEGTFRRNCPHCEVPMYCPETIKPKN